MKNSVLQHYKNLYTSAKNMGSGELLRDFLKLEQDIVLPVTIAHGVDYDSHAEIMDIGSPEPLQWVCDDSLSNYRKNFLKPTFLAPHPWLLSMKNFNLKPQQGEGSLLIGPPPSPSNDQLMFEIIKEDLKNMKYSILIKPRGNYQDSIKFWESKGVSAVSAGLPDNNFYPRLFEIINQHEIIVAGNFSSVLIFASSIGKQIKILTGYQFSVYEHPEYFNNSSIHKGVDFSREPAKKIVKIFLSQDQPAMQELSKRLLGHKFLAQPIKVKVALENSIKKLKNPFFFKSKFSYPFLFSMPQKIRVFLATLTGKPGYLIYSIPEFFRFLSLKGNRVIIMFNEFDAWQHGMNAENCRVTPVARSALKKANMGHAPDGYNQ